MIIRIRSLEDPALQVFTAASEHQLRNRDHPEDGLFLAESPLVIERALDAGYTPVCALMETSQLDSQRERLLPRLGEIPVYTGAMELLADLTGFHLTRGAWCAMRRKSLPSLEEICAGASRIAVLEEVENPTNAGAIVRSAAALGMDAVLFTPGCADPLYRRAVRVSMGCIFQIPWTVLPAWPEGGMERLKAMGFATAAMALRPDALRVDNPALQSREKLAVILGTEGDGLKKETIALCDYTVMIPMEHGVDSLNVAAASAVAFWQLRREH